jgi:hypothetical protein
MGNHPSKEEIMNPVAGAVFVPIVAILGVFCFLSVSVWSGSRKNEREAFYKSESLRRITEASGEGAKLAMDLLKEEERLRRIKAREGLKIGGIICLAVGLGMGIFLRAITPEAAYLVGLIPGLIGVALLVYVFLMAPPVE